jgi:hypothetical protein
MRREESRTNGVVGAYLRQVPETKRRPIVRLLNLYVSCHAPRATALDFDWSLVSPTTVVQARLRLAKRYSPSTVNSVLSCVKAVLKQALRMGLVSAEQYLDAAGVSGIDRERPTPSLALTTDCLASLFNVCGRDTRTEGRRDAFVILLIACAGFDRREVTQLFDLEPPNPIDGGYYAAQLRQKQGAQCSLVLQGRACSIVSAWLEARGTGGGPAVCKISKEGDVCAAQGVSQQLTYYILRRRAKEAGLSISTTALRWYYRLHLARGTLPAKAVAAMNVRYVIEPPWGEIDPS